MIFNLEPMNQWVFSMNLVSSFKVTTASTGGFRNDESVYIWHPVEATVKRLHRLTFKLILFNRRLSVPSSVCLSFPLSIRSLVWPPVRFFIDPSVGLSVFLSIRTSVQYSVGLSVRSSACSSVCPSITSSVCGFVRPFFDHRLSFPYRELSGERKRANGVCFSLPKVENMIEYSLNKIRTSSGNKAMRISKKFTQNNML